MELILSTNVKEEIVYHLTHLLGKYHSLSHLIKSTCTFNRIVGKLGMNHAIFYFH